MCDLPLIQKPCLIPLAQQALSCIYGDYITYHQNEDTLESESWCY